MYIYKLLKIYGNFFKIYFIFTLQIKSIYLVSIQYFHIQIFQLLFFSRQLEKVQYKK